MNYLLFIFIAVDVIQGLYIKWLKKKIALRDGTYKETVRKPQKIWKKDEECDIIVM